LGTGVLPGESYATKESDGEATAVDDGAGGVARHQASRTRVARRRCQGERFWAIPGARKRVWSGARHVGRPVADAGGERRHGEKQRGRRGDGDEGNLVNKLKFKIQFANSVFLLLLGLK